MRYELMLPHQIRAAIDGQWPIVLPLGVLEYHGEHMAVGMDTLAVTVVAAFILSLVLCWNEYFFTLPLTGFDAQTLPVMVASQTGSSGINWWTIAALATAVITPLLLIGIFLERYIVMALTGGAGK
jgi:ABC-type maltose transport system permease subunit